jgi:hypothetical protein
LHRHLHGYNLAVADILLDHVAKLTPGAVLLFTQQIARREVLEAVVLDQFGTLCALARAGSAENKNDEGVGRGEERVVAVRCGEGLWVCRCHFD